jgi:TonB family protein
MLGTLIETRSARPRRLGGSLVSVAAHIGVIGLAVAVTARATPRPPRATAVATTVVYLPPTPQQTSAPPSAPQPVSTSTFRLPTPAPIDIAPVTIPTRLPPIDPSKIVTDEHWYDHRHLPSTAAPDPRGDGPSTGPVNGAWTAASVDRAVVPLEGNPHPAYPEQMRAAHLEGQVDVRFVVDTAGRAEPGTITIVAATHAQFADAVRVVLLRSRYRPAEVRGRHVRQLVEQRFDFTLTH